MVRVTFVSVFGEWNGCGSHYRGKDAKIPFVLGAFERQVMNIRSVGVTGIKRPGCSWRRAFFAMEQPLLITNTNFSLLIASLAISTLMLLLS